MAFVCFHVYLEEAESQILMTGGPTNAQAAFTGFKDRGGVV